VRLVLTTELGTTNSWKIFFDIKSHGVGHAIFIGQKPSVFMDALVKREGTPLHIHPLKKGGRGDFHPGAAQRLHALTKGREESRVMNSQICPHDPGRPKEWRQHPSWQRPVPHREGTPHPWGR